MKPRTLAFLAAHRLRPRGPESLPALAAALAADYPTITHIAPPKLQAKMMDPHRLCLLDARTPEEFAVSHLPGALRVDPEARPDDVVAALGTGTKDADVVVYCSVGVRSTRLAARAAPALHAAGVCTVANLAGGIFAWAASGAPLNAARHVHPYDAVWGRLLDPRVPQSMG